MSEMKAFYKPYSTMYNVEKSSVLIGGMVYKLIHVYVLLILLPPTEPINYRFYAVKIYFFSHYLAVWLKESSNDGLAEI